MTKVTLHGELSEKVGKKIWNLSVNSVNEALKAIEIQSKKLYKTFLQHHKKDIKYRILINGKDFMFDHSKGVEDLDGVLSSEIVMNFKELRSIDVVPVFEGSGFSGGEDSTDSKSIIAIIAGVVLVAVGMMTGNPALAMAGIGLIAAGITNLLTPRPKFDDFEQIDSGNSKKNQLFTGPQNTIREGGPVFVGYGRLLIGSHVIHSVLKTYDVLNGETVDKSRYTPFSYWGNEYYGLDYREHIKIKNRTKNSVTETKKAISERNYSSLNPSVPINKPGAVSNFADNEKQYIFELANGNFFYCSDSEE